MKKLCDLTKEEKKAYQDFIYLIHFKSFVELYGIETIKGFSLDIFHCTCFRNTKDLSEVPDFIKSLYYIARDIQKHLSNESIISNEALKFIRDNVISEKYNGIGFSEYLGNLN